jgi:hypothetical protein
MRINGTAFNCEVCGQPARVWGRTKAATGSGGYTVTGRQDRVNVDLAATIFIGLDVCFNCARPALEDAIRDLWLDVKNQATL